MRLLNVTTHLFKEFYDHEVPAYGVLSHRWGADEVTYKDFLKGRKKDSAGYKKVLDFCTFVRERKIFDLDSRPTRKRRDFGENDRGGRTPVSPVAGDCLEWVWIDTVCIQKSSSQELSEAINSMFEWYANSEECYVYMSDVPPTATTPSDIFWKEFDTSDWFNRGWTLQEMLAPTTVVFCDRNWDIFGHLQTHSGQKQYAELAPWSGALRFELNERISKITGIQPEYIRGTEAIASASIARRMSWASRRQTTRIEDRAYCLMGLFDVNMPLLYGEGHKAILRLQEEIIKRSSDQSIFAWRCTDPDAEMTGILAPDIKCFENCGEVVQKARVTDQARGELRAPFAITNLGLQLTTQARKVARFQGTRMSPQSQLYIVQLNCVGTPGPLQIELVILECAHGESIQHSRSRLNDIRGRNWHLASLPFELRTAEQRQFYIKLANHNAKGINRRTRNGCSKCRELEWMIIGNCPTP